MGATSFYGRGGHEFRDTVWTLVLKAADKDNPESTAALEELCSIYWYPIYVYIRRQGYSPEDAEDHTQAFFAFLFEKNALRNLDREGGKFRHWLQRVCGNFLKSQYRVEKAQKRGGGKKFVSIDDTTELRYQGELAETPDPEAHYDRQWAMALLVCVLSRLQKEFEDKGKGQLFEQLRGHLVADADPPTYAELAARTGSTEASQQMAVKRLRERYGKLLREEIGATVSSFEELDDEVRYLRSVLARAAP
jgi:DNA-directed RNA polymerase specialized sigma24 family protein